MNFDCTTLSGIDQATCEALFDESAFFVYITEFLHFFSVFFIVIFILYFIIYKWVFQLK